MHAVCRHGMACVEPMSGRTAGAMKGRYSGCGTPTGRISTAVAAHREVAGGGVHRGDLLLQLQNSGEKVFGLVSDGEGCTGAARSKAVQVPAGCMHGSGVPPAVGGLAPAGACLQGWRCTQSTHRDGLGGDIALGGGDLRVGASGEVVGREAGWATPCESRRRRLAAAAACGAAHHQQPWCSAHHPGSILSCT